VVSGDRSGLRRRIWQAASPLGGIGLTIAELDGLAIVAAASRPSYYWPEP
jgi:hypothetical protein